MEFNARHGFVAGIDLGPTKTRLAVADLRGERLAHRVMPTPTDLAPRALLARLAGACARSCAKRRSRSTGCWRWARARPAPWTASAEWRRARSQPEGLVERADGATILRRALGVPVVVENDVNLAVLGEHWRGAARGHDTCVFVTVGTGIGAGMLVDGELHRGHHFLAGEIGLMCMGPQYVDQDFGTRGCLETLAGLKALATRWPRRRAGATRDSWVGELFEAAQTRGDRPSTRWPRRRCSSGSRWRT